MKLAPFHYNHLRCCFAILSKGLQRSNSVESPTLSSENNIPKSPVDIQPAPMEISALPDSVIHPNNNAENKAQGAVYDISKVAYPALNHNQSTDLASSTTLVSTTAIPQPITVVDTAQFPEIPKIVSSEEPTQNAGKVHHLTFDRNQQEVPATRFFTNLPWQNNDKPTPENSAHSESTYEDTEQPSTQNIHTHNPSQKTVLSVARQSDSGDHRNAVLPANATINNATPVYVATHATALHATHPESSMNSGIIDLSQLATAFFTRLPWQLPLEQTTKTTDQSAEPVSFTTTLSEEAIVFVQTLPTQESISIRAGRELSDKDREQLKILAPPEQSNPIFMATHHALNPYQHSNGLFNRSTETSSVNLTTLTSRRFFQMLPWSTQAKTTRKPVLETSP